MPIVAESAPRFKGSRRGGVRCAPPAQNWNGRLSGGPHGTCAASVEPRRPDHPARGRRARPDRDVVRPPRDDLQPGTAQRVHPLRSLLRVSPQRDPPRSRGRAALSPADRGAQGDRRGDRPRDRDGEEDPVHPRDPEHGRDPDDRLDGGPRPCFPSDGGVRRGPRRPEHGRSHVHGGARDGATVVSRERPARRLAREHRHLCHGRPVGLHGCGHGPDGP